jgi:hypothetical protein
MSKKKLSNEQKLKRQVEVLKAQVKAQSSNMNRVYQEVLHTKPTANVESFSAPVKKEAHALPISEIKKDLLKTAVFSVFSIGVVLALHFSNLDLITLFRLK